MKQTRKNNMKKITGLASVIVLFLCAYIPFLSNANNESDDTTRPYIVATTSQIGDLVQNIAGEHLRVDFLMGTGIDPHMYHPTRSDVSKMLRGEIVFYNGMNLEGKMEHFLEKLSEKKQAINISDSLMDGGSVLKDQKNAYDPHIWMDIQNWIVACHAVEEVLIKTYPQYSQAFKQNSARYLQKLTTLNQWTKDTLASIPENQRVLVTAHDAFGYLGNAYGLEVIGIQGISTESEAGLKKIEYLVGFITDEKIPSVFIETSVANHNIRAIIEGARARGAEVEIGGKLYSDAMGQANTYEGTYIGMMKHNIRTITRSLGGQVIEGNILPTPNDEETH